MKKDFILWLVISAVIMLLFPFLAVTFVKADAGMAFIMYTVIYLILGMLAMLISMLIGKKTHQ